MAFVQRELDTASSELGERGVYLGEWHSHLVSDPSPSPLDIESMSGIACSPEYSTICPALVLAGLDPNSGMVQEIKAWSFGAGRRIEMLTVEVTKEG